MTAEATSAGHYPADPRWRDDGFDTFCACGMVWPCLHSDRAVPKPSAGSGRAGASRGPGVCHECSQFLGEHDDESVCPYCDEDWSDLPAPPACRVLWDDGDLFLNGVWVGYAGCERGGEDRSYATWLRGRGRGWGAVRYRTRAEAQAALIERVAREIGARGGVP